LAGGSHAQSAPGRLGARVEGGVKLVRDTLRAAVLRVLAEGPAHGYLILKRIEEATGGYWRPTPGTLYPLLDQLVREGVVEVASVEREVKGGKRVTYRLTPKGWRELASIVLFKAGLRPHYTLFQVVEAIEHLRRAGLEEEAARACSVLRDNLRRVQESLERICR
jgi:DNA-binding PadR family transcriptional regulator